MPRNYRREYDTFQGKPEQIKKRAMRNAARAKMAKAGKVHKGDGMDVDHTKAIDKGGNNTTGLRVVSKSSNRSFDRDSKRNLISQISPRERKKKK